MSFNKVVFWYFRDTVSVEIFILVANVLEIVFASSNFYLYVLCNKQIRSKVAAVSTFFLVHFNWLIFSPNDISYKSALASDDRVIFNPNDQ